MSGPCPVLLLPALAEHQTPDMTVFAGTLRDRSRAAGLEAQTGA